MDWIDAVVVQHVEDIPHESVHVHVHVHAEEDRKDDEMDEDDEMDVHNIHGVIAADIHAEVDVHVRVPLGLHLPGVDGGS